MIVSSVVTVSVSKSRDQCGLEAPSLFFRDFRVFFPDFFRIFIDLFRIFFDFFRFFRIFSAKKKQFDPEFFENPEFFRPWVYFFLHKKKPELDNADLELFPYSI